MFRLLAPIVNLIAAITIGGLFQAGVSLNVQTPQEVVAGTEFEVTVNIEKGDLESFSRLQQSFPAGLTASSYLSSNADFTSEDKRVRFIWLRLPRQESFSVVYKIKVDERLKGTFSIDSKFSYIDQNERKSVNISSSPIVILPSPDIDPALIVDINEFEQKVIPYIPPIGGETEMACIRQQPVRNPSGEGYLVTLLVNKESKQKFAKIEESIPAGYTAESIDPKEAIFTFKGGTAKFLWMNLPEAPYFMVSYRLIPTGSGVKEPDIRGKFSYLEEEKTISIDIKQTDRNLASLSPSEVGELLAYVNSPQYAEAKTVKEPEKTRQQQQVQTEQKPRETGKTKPAEEKKNQTAQTKTSTGRNKGRQNHQLEPESGVYYRVQLAAGHKKVNVEQYFKKYNLDKEVRRETHEGWHKYSIGSFPVYKEARDYRVHIWNTTVIDDAFVSAYNDGERITVQEALMIANQEWYK